MSDFRFEDLEVWKDAVSMTKELFQLTEQLRTNRRYSASDQLFRAVLSITNNIAEGSGSSSSKEFANYLNISRRSVFECANMILIFHAIGIITSEYKENLIKRLQNLSRKLYNFRLKLLSSP